MRKMILLFAFASITLQAHGSFRMEFNQAAFEFLQKNSFFDFYGYDRVIFSIDSEEHPEEQRLESFRPADILPWVESSQELSK